VSPVVPDVPQSGHQELQNITPSVTAFILNKLIFLPLLVFFTNGIAQDRK